MDKLKKVLNSNSNLNAYFYYISAMILTGLFLAGLYLTEGDVLVNFLHAWDDCSLMDFFLILGASPDSYLNGGIYPPLAYGIAIFFRHFINPELSELESNAGAKTHQASLMLAIVCIVIFAICVVHICYGLLKVHSSEKLLFVMLLFFSIPMLFEIERLNILFISWIFSGIFFCYKDSSNKLYREISYICLAIAAAIKIYPAILGLLLVLEKRYKDALHTIIYGILMFFLPFLYFGGISQLPQNLSTLFLNFGSGVDKMVSSHGNYNISYHAIGDYFGEIIGAPDIVSILPSIFIVFGIITSFLTKEYKKKVLVLTCLLIGIPSSSFCYVGIFLVFPIILFINDREDKRKSNILYFILFALILFPLPIDYFTEYENKRQFFWNNVSPFTVQQMISLTALQILLFIEAIVVHVQIKINLKSPN